MASITNPVVVYDTPSKAGKTWSHHTLRMLFSLHYKGIPYSIKAVDYPDIIATFTPTTLTPKDDPVEPYEIPVLAFPSLINSLPTYEMLTPRIIATLEALVPEPSLLYDTPRSVEFRKHHWKALVPILQYAIPHVPLLLLPSSALFFSQKRQGRWGKSLEQWRIEHPLEEAFATAELRLEAFGQWIAETEGAFIEGASGPGYADFTFVSVLGFVRALGLEEVWGRVLGIHPALGKLWEGVGKGQVGNESCGHIFETKYGG